MEKALIVYIPLTETFRSKNRSKVLSESLKELNTYLAEGWSVKSSSPFGMGSETTACNLVILSK